MSPFQTESFFDRLQTAAKRAGFQIIPFGYVHKHPLLVLQREADSPGGKAHFYLSAGIHGDEPAGPLALLRLLQNRYFSREISWTLFPLLNPTGLSEGRRENREGCDLNRDYFHGETPEVQAHLQWLEVNAPERGYDLAMHLHEDWEAGGFYLYELNHRTDAPIGPRVLRVVGDSFSLDSSEYIDGYPSNQGRIAPLEADHYALDQESELPGAEAIYLFKRHARMTVTFETPSSLPIAERVDAQAMAVQAGVSEWEENVS